MSCFMSCAVLTIGTELTRGELTNTNASWLSRRLTELGFEVLEQAVVDDQRERVVAALLRLTHAHDLVLVTGGLGPTTDDLTSECAALALGVALVRDAGALEHIRARFARLGRPMSPTNDKQADFPEGADILANPVGSAPGFAIALGRGHAYFMPGVPREMMRMFDEEIAPRVGSRAARDTCQVSLRTFGLPESAIGERLDGIERAHPGVTLGYRAHFPEVEVKVHARGADQDAARLLCDTAATEVRERLGDAIWGEGDETFAQVVARGFVDRGLTLALAESCTGGLVAHLLTREAGASAYLLAGAVTYANSAKVTFADVSPDTLAAHGAVSAEVAKEMAEGIRARAGADVGLSITGVAGPGGGSIEKPVGTVYLAVATARGATTFHRFFASDRGFVQQYAAHCALDLLRRAVASLG